MPNYREHLKNLVPNAVWDILKMLFGAALGTYPGGVILRWWQTMPNDVAFSAAFFIGLFVLIVYKGTHPLLLRLRAKYIDDSVENLDRPVRLQENQDTLVYKPHIVVVTEEFTHGVAFDGVAFRSVERTNKEATHIAIIARLENVPTVPPRKIGIPQKVHARIAYNALNHGHDIFQTPVNYAMWVGHELPFVDFPLNSPRYLILGIIRYDASAVEVLYGALQLFGYSFENDRPTMLVQIGGGRWGVYVKVDLIIGEHAEWAHRFEFEIELLEGGGMRFDVIKPKRPKIKVKPLRT